MKDLVNNKYVRLSLMLIAGGLIGWFIKPSGQSANENVTESTLQEQQKEQIWTCSMHPQIRKTEPGKCPLCGMDLIPVNNESNSDADPMAISMSETAIQLANIRTIITSIGKPIKELRLPGKVQADERMIYSQASHLQGRIEQLKVNFTGEPVKKGQVLALIYSPELVTAQEELFEAIKIKAQQPLLLEAAKEKLKNWKLTDKQIDEILASGKPRESFEVLADVSGIIVKKMVSLGDYVNKGMPLFDVADLSKVWVLFDVYESEIQWVKVGSKIDFSIQSVPGETFKGTISFIDPVINPQTRVAQARVEFSNVDMKLKPEMFANGIIQSELKGGKDGLVIPKSAVLWTGERSVVYVKSTSEKGVSFLMQEVILGPSLGDSYMIKSGLNPGTEIAVNGTFSIDAAAQLAGKPSMMNPTGGKVATGGHAGMDMGDGKNKMNDADMAKMKPEMKIDKSKVPDTFKKQLGKAVSDYIKIKDKLANDDNNLKTDIGTFKKSLNAVDMSLVMGDAHNSWMKSLKAINKDLGLLLKEVNIDAQRTIFNSISNSLMNATSSLGLKMENGEAVYLQFCPMANDNTGGYWLSTDEVIRNPYFGSKMIKCGSTKDTLTKD